MAYRLGAEAGIALGPILLVIALLAILATAIAAGGSNFTAGAAQEGNRTNSSAIIQMGLNLKSAADRIVGQGTAIANVDVNASNTTGEMSLFSMEGGGMAALPTTLAANPTSDTWIFTWGEVTDLGSASRERIALLRISQGHCDDVNTLLNNGATPAAEDLGAIDNTTNFSAWPSALAQKMSGCLNNSNTNASGYYFYQVLNAQ